MPAVLWMIVIFYLSHQQGSELHSFLPFFQRWFPAMSSFNWGHLVAYFILSWLLFMALGEKYNSFKGKSLVVSLCLLYGISDEIHQSYIPGRTPQLLDIRNDTLGAAFGMIFISIPPFRSVVSKLLSSKIYYDKKTG
ncbi:VanZ family protein [Chengkuizengella axinellae]|uniref:VanZ family protein n=1 Tax=Chengkuizengella axinellae TaxID=3064388 RepID=A0ABT9IW44_9BACL|nr:VanZ family protein [Chengkuizengella sp. 2205SS18-9]MDP5273317.1 VanZ family protein [Chengkuizengella sp. 2205SS18-9]